MASNNHASRELVGLSLRLHELAIHTGDLKHSCLACGYEHNCASTAVRCCWRQRKLWLSSRPT